VADFPCRRLIINLNNNYHTLSDILYILFLDCSELLSNIIPFFFYYLKFIYYIDMRFGEIQHFDVLNCCIRLFIHCRQIYASHSLHILWFIFEESVSSKQIWQVNDSILNIYKYFLILNLIDFNKLFINYHS
jgi:hypothetical protein